MTSELKELFERAKLPNLISFIYCGSETDDEIDDYSKSIDQAHKQFYENLHAIFPNIDISSDNDDLYDAVASLTDPLERIYFEMGILVTLQLFNVANDYMLKLKTMENMEKEDDINILEPLIKHRTNIKNSGYLKILKDPEYIEITDKIDVIEEKLRASIGNQEDLLNEWMSLYLERLNICEDHMYTLGFQDAGILSRFFK